MMLNWKKQRKMWRWVGAIGLVLLLHLSGLSKPLENFISKVVSPLARSLHEVGAGAQKNPDAAKTSEELAIELELMKNRLASATIDQSQLRLLEEENDKLREQLNFVNSNNYRVISANIVSRQNLFDAAGGRDIIIDKGTVDGIRSGLGVINEVGVIIGKIVEVRANSARACLTTDSGCQLAAAIVNGSKTIGLSDGELGLTIKMNFIPQIEKIVPEDIVITSGL